MKRTMSTSVATIATIAVTSLTCSVMSPAFANTTDTNLAQNASIQTNVTGVTDNQFATMEATYPASLLSTTNWHGFCRQGGRNIIITLPQVSTIDSVSIQFEQAPGSGVNYPDSVEFDVAQNGSWQNLGTAHSGIPLTDKRNSVHTFQVQLNHVSGQVLRIQFPVGVWVFARNLKVMGTPAGSGVTNPSAPASGGPSVGSPLSPISARAAGIKNMLLVYTGGYGTQGTWSASDFAPMLTYQPQQQTVIGQSTTGQTSIGQTTTGQTIPGQTTTVEPPVGQSSFGQTGFTTGRMFDSMLFLPYGTVPNTQAGWTSYLQDLFAPNQQLSALNTAVANADQTMATPAFQENVVLTIPYAPYGTNSWGTVNGQTINFAGSATDPNGVSARVAAMNSELQTLMADWKQSNFQHLHLSGIYWENESFSDAAAGDTDVLKATISQVHQDGLPLFWIPFYGAENNFNWQQLGFDAAWLQPNYVEQGQNADVTRLRNAESEATRFGMGMELELNGMDGTNGSLYEQSLRQFTLDGFGKNVSHAFYDGSKLLVYAADSTDPATRALYDNTFAFINGSN